MARKIQTERLWIIEYDLQYVDQVTELMSHWQVTKNTAKWKFPPDRDYIIECMQKGAPETGFSGRIFAGDQFVGSAGVANAALWYLFHTEHGGRSMRAKQPRP